MHNQEFMMRQKSRFANEIGERYGETEYSGDEVL